MKTYLKIAQFFNKKGELVSFYSEYTPGANPFDIFPPFNNPNRLADVWDLEQIIQNDGLEFAKILGGLNPLKVIRKGEYYNDEIGYLLYDFLLDIQKNVSPSKKSAAPDAIDDEQIDTSTMLSENNFQLYKDFVVQFEDLMVKSLEREKRKIFWDEILLVELILKNIGKSFFIDLGEYQKENVEMYNTSLIYFQSMSQSAKFINHTLFISRYNYYRLYTPPLPNPLSSRENFQIATHIEYLNQYYGNIFVRLNWIASKHPEIGSNLSKSFGKSDYVRIKFKDLIKYTQNYIDYKNDKEYGGLMQFIDWFEHFVIQLQPNYEPCKVIKKGHLDWEDTLDGLKEIGYDFNSIEDKSMYISKYYYLIKDHLNISWEHAVYFRYLHRVLKYAHREDVFNTDLQIYIPYWEIPRAQSINLEHLNLEDLNDHLRSSYEDPD